MEQRRVAFCTLGCKVNQYETNAMMQEFIEHGYKVTKFDEVADIYIVNTCTVTNMADKKSRQMLRRVKEINPNAILVAVGCYAQVGKEELEKIPEIDYILGNNEKKNLIPMLEDLRNSKQKEKITDVLYQKDFIDFGTITHTDKTRAVIKIQDGCDRFCSYCIIPYARGRVRSRKTESIIEEITKIAEQGIKEFVLTGIHITSYGKDFKEKYSLINLLEEIQPIDGIERIRLGSIEPTLITEKFVTRLKKLNKVCDHFHLSLQSGCNETLKRMNRRYTTAEFEQCTQLLRKVYPNVCLTTDIIVGFPGETEEEFKKTYDFLTKIVFYKMHIFKYSPRKGTKAAVMPGQIDGHIKEERSRKLIQLSNKNEQEYNTKYMGKIVQVLLEDELHKEDEKQFLKGHTTNYMVIKVEVKENKVAKLAGTMQQVKIIKSEGLELVGELTNIAKN